MDAQRTKQKSKLGTVLDKYTLLDYRTIWKDVFNIWQFPTISDMPTTHHDVVYMFNETGQRESHVDSVT